MKNIYSIILVALIAILGLGANCQKPTPREIANHTLDVTQVACILIQEWTSDESVVAKICNIVEEYLPEVRKIIAASKQAKAMKAAMVAASASAPPPAATSAPPSASATPAPKSAPATSSSK